MDQRIRAYLQGASHTGYEVFGAHFSHEYEQDGVRFTVYAPRASLVELIGEFNGWDGWPMHRHPTGVWSIFAKDIPFGALYKYRIHTMDYQVYDRADPFAFYSQKRPDTASIVYSMDGFAWNDAAYLSSRDKNYQKPMNIYEVHAGSWRRGTNGGFFSYDTLGDELIPYVQALGCTHIELLPLTEHPFDGSWGYQVAGYFAATSRYGEPKQLMRFVDRCHQAGLGVIMDFVPVHFVKDFYALHQFDGSYLYESEEESLRYSEWDTALFDYTKPHVLSFMKSALDFWLTYYHIDGVRYDAVSCLIYHGGNPDRGLNEPGIWFLKNANYALGNKWPGVMLIAEDSSMYLKVTAPVAYGGLGFDYKWDLGFMNDTFQYLGSGNRAAGRISASTDYFYQEKYILPFSHDEVVHCKKTVFEKMPGSRQEQYAQARALYLYLFTHPGKKLNFMGNELAVREEWNESGEISWNMLCKLSNAAFHRYFAALGDLYRREPALYETDLHPEGFAWRKTENGVFIYERRSLAGKRLVVALNFSGKPYDGLCVPEPNGVWEELLSTEDTAYGGGGQVNGTIKITDGQLRFRLPAYGGCVLQQKN